jgi:VanZ family protein
LAGSARRPILIAAAISFAYACSDEYHQTLVESRHGAVADVAVDSFGILLAALALQRLRPGVRPRSSLAR